MDSINLQTTTTICDNNKQITNEKCNCSTINRNRENSDDEKNNEDEDTQRYSPDLK